MLQTEEARQAAFDEHIRVPQSHLEGGTGPQYLPGPRVDAHIRAALVRATAHATTTWQEHRIDQRGAFGMLAGVAADKLRRGA